MTRSSFTSQSRQAAKATSPAASCARLSVSGCFVLGASFSPVVHHFVASTAPPDF